MSNSVLVFYHGLLPAGKTAEQHLHYLGSASSLNFSHLQPQNTGDAAGLGNATLVLVSWLTSSPMCFKDSATAGVGYSPLRLTMMTRWDCVKDEDTQGAKMNVWKELGLVMVMAPLCHPMHAAAESINLHLTGGPASRFWAAMVLRP